MESLSKREKVMLLTLGIVLFAYLYYSLFFSTVQNKIKASMANINEYIEDINSANLYKKELEQDTKELEDVKKKYEEAKIALPDMEMNPEIIYNIQKFFEGSGVRVNNISIGMPEELQYGGNNPESEGEAQNINNGQNTNGTGDTLNNRGTGKLYSVTVTISLSGDSYEQVMNFISLFENDKRFVEVTRIDITAEGSVSQAANQVSPGNKIDASIAAKYYYIDSGSDKQPKYEFNTGVAGKKDLFGY